MNLQPPNAGGANHPMLAPPGFQGPQQAAPPANGGAAIGPQVRIPAPDGAVQQGQAQAVAGQPAPQVNRTFSSYYQDPANDPLRNTWQQVLRRFDDARTNANTLLTAAVSMPIAAPCAYLCCTTLHPNTPPRVYLLHTLSRFPPASLDGTITPWDDQLIGCLGDVLQDTVATVTLPATAFDLTAHNRVYTAETLPDHLAQLPAQDMFPRLADIEVGTEQLQTRHLMYLPARFAYLFLGNRGRTPKDAYLTFHQVVEHEGGRIEDVQPILDWLKLTLHATREDNAGPPVTSVVLNIALVDDDLSHHRSPLVAHILAPRPQQITTGLELAINHMATAVSQQTAEVNRATSARAVEREAPTTPSSKFGLLLDSLKHYLHVQEEQELPEFWFQFVAASKKQEFSVLRD